MPTSKQAHVLAILRKHLYLKQTELAELANCSVPTIQSIELNRLSLSPGLAARISAATGADFDWLRRNDVNQPMPPVRTLATKDKLISQLMRGFKELSAVASLTPRGPDRETLPLSSPGSYPG
jgi:transcriptional regulator with XRE-family HTH domain